MITRGCWCLFVIAAVCLCLTLDALIEHDMTHHQTYSQPARWQYAAAKEGHTFHAKGCGLLPRHLRPDEMVYGNSVAEMLRVPDKSPCPYCIRESDDQ